MTQYLVLHPKGFILKGWTETHRSHRERVAVEPYDRPTQSAARGHFPTSQVALAALPLPRYRTIDNGVKIQSSDIDIGLTVLTFFSPIFICALIFCILFCGMIGVAVSCAESDVRARSAQRWEIGQRGDGEMCEWSQHPTDTT